MGGTIVFKVDSRRHRGRYAICISPRTQRFCCLCQWWAPLGKRRYGGEWKDKLRQLKTEGLFYNQVRFYPADFEDSSDLARAWDLLHKHGFALKQANTVVFNHSGFDFEGNVINERRAYDTLHDLGMYLHAMRGLRMEIAEEGHKVQQVRQPSWDQ